jgi:hypothetical protein
VPRSAWAISVGRQRLVWNAVEITGDVLMAQLPKD